VFCSPGLVRHYHHLVRRQQASGDAQARRIEARIWLTTRDDAVGAGLWI